VDFSSYKKFNAIATMKLTDMKLLEGQTEEITMTDLRSRPGDVVDQVQMGKEFTITKAGKVVAVVHAPEPTALELGAAIRKLGLGGR
jgi:prevent-host-death family protein